MNAEKKVKCPRWHYRDVKKEVEDILDNAKADGNLKGAMIEYILKRSDRLPEGMTPETTVDSILKTVDGFALAHEEGRSKEDIKEALKESIADMEPAKALAYLAVLESTFRACDVNAVSEDKVDGAKLAEEIKNAVENAEADDIASRIDRLADMILGDSLTAYVYAEGNSDLKYMVETPEDVTNIGDETSAMIYDAIIKRTKKAEVFAATACACYGMILDGKIKGVDANNLDVSVMTALVIGGMEKGSILTRLARGEIDEEVARGLLDALGRALKWILVKLIQAAFVVCTLWAILTFVTLFAWLMASAGVFFVMGLIAVGGAAIEMEEHIDAAVSFLGKLCEKAIAKVCSGVAWVWNKCSDAVRSIVANAQRAGATA